MKRTVAVTAAVLAVGLSSIVRATSPGSNGKIAFATTRDSNYEIYSMNPDGTGLTNLTNSDGIDTHPAWSPDGSQIAFVSNRGTFSQTDLYVMSADGSSVRKLAGYANQPAWAPDGTRIVYVCSQTNICVVNADGTGQTLVHADTEKLGGPVWSPNGGLIAFARPMASVIRPQIFLMRPDGTGVTQLTTDGGVDPDWSPDGSQIAFASDRNSETGNMDVYVMDVAVGEGGVTRLTFSTGTTPNNTPVGSFSPAWSPDGLEIAFDTNRDGNQEVYTMRADGSLQINVSASPWTDARPDWQPVSGSVVLTVEDVRVNEGDSGATNADFTVRLSGASSTAVIVDYATADGTATAGSDYTAASGSLTFAPGETSKTISIAVTGDTDHEPDETFVVDLTNAAGATMGDAQGVATIVDDDELVPELSVSDVVVPEGDSGSTPAMFDVKLSQAAAQTITVRVRTVGGTAGDCVDYVCVDFLVTFAPGETVKPVTIGVLGDTELEADETFTVVLSSATNATIADGTGNGTILNDDAAVVSAADLTVVEGNLNSTQLIELTIPHAEMLPVEVAYAATGGTATNGVDYVLASGTVTFTPGSTTVYVPLLVVGDVAYEGDETIEIALTSVRNANVGDGVVVVTIVNDDAVAYPDLVISSVSAPETAWPGETVTISYTVTNRGTATAYGYYSPLCEEWRDRVSTTGSSWWWQPCQREPLAPGSSYTRTFTRTMPTAERYGVGLMFKTDVENVVYESDEGNNNFVHWIRLAKPDLVVTAVAAPETAAPGEVVTISYTVKNWGYWRAGDESGGCQWYDLVRVMPGGWFVSQCVTEPLEPKSSYTRTVTVPIPQNVLDEVSLTVTTDKRHMVTESTESNNSSAVTIVIVRPGR